MALDDDSDAGHARPGPAAKPVRTARVALDDIGSGYSSLEHLGCLPIDILKVDRFSPAVDLSRALAHGRERAA